MRAVPLSFEPLFGLFLTPVSPHAAESVGQVKAMFERVATSICHFGVAMTGKAVIQIAMIERMRETARAGLERRMRGRRNGAATGRYGAETLR